MQVLCSLVLHELLVAFFLKGGVSIIGLEHGSKLKLGRSFDIDIYIQNHPSVLI